MPYVPFAHQSPFYQHVGANRACGDGPTAPHSVAWPVVPSFSRASWGPAPPKLHRFWLQRLQPDTSVTFPALYVHSLRVFQPLDQTLWYMGPKPRLPHIPGVSLVKVPDNVLKASVGLWMAQFIPAPLVKDFVALQLVFEKGGLFIDLDAVSLGRHLPSCAEPVFSREPARPVGAAFARKDLALNFGVFGGPPGCQWMLALSEKLKKHWQDFIVRRLKGGWDFPDWRGEWQPVSTYVMYNQRELSTAVQANCRPSHIARPIVYHALPWYFESWRQLGTRVRQYDIPSETALLQSAILLNLWGSQWDTATQERTVRWALAVQSARLCSRVPDITTAGSRLRRSGCPGAPCPGACFSALCAQLRILVQRGAFSFIPPCAPAGEANTYVHLFFDSAAVPSCGRPSPFAPGAYVRTRGSRGRARLRRAPQVPPEGGGEILLRTCQAIARLSKALAPRKSCY